jgi:Tripartite tricarboxylate transporter family receptor
VFSFAAGISLTHVPYKGATQAATDIAAGQMPVGFQGLGTVEALVRGGQLSLIGVTTEKRLPQFSDVPTVSESSLLGFFFNSWFALLMPVGTSKEIVARLNAEVLMATGDGKSAASWKSWGLPCAAAPGGPARHDTGSAHELCARDQGNGHRERTSRRSKGGISRFAGWGPILAKTVASLRNQEF